MSKKDLINIGMCLGFGVAIGQVGANILASAALRMAERIIGLCEKNEDENIISEDKVLHWDDLESNKD